MPDPSSPTPVEGYDDDPPRPPLPGAEAPPAPAGAGANEPVEVTAEPAPGDQATHAPPADDGAPRATQDVNSPAPGSAPVQVEGPVEVDDDASATDPTPHPSGPSAPAEAGGDRPVDTTPVDTTPVDQTGDVAPDRVDAAPPPPTTVPTAETPPTTGSSNGGDDGSDETAGDLEPDEPSGRRNRKKVEIDLRFLLALLVVVALAAGAYTLGQRQGDKLDQAVDGSTGTTVFKAPKEFIPLADPATGVKLSVPRDWVQYSTKDLPDKALRLSVGIPNTGDTVVVRVSSYSTEITEANLGDQKNVFDQLLGAENIQVFVNQPTKLAGLPALFYVYRFTDQATGKAGIHAHYFVFQGRKMVSLIFQALPETRYETLAPTFDTVANSLEVAPGPPPDFLQPPVPDSTPTTAAPGTPSAPAPAPPTTG